MDLNRAESAVLPAEEESPVLNEALPKIVALFTYLKLDDEAHQDKCLSRVGKSPNYMQHGDHVTIKHMGSNQLSRQHSTVKHISKSAAMRAKVAQMEARRDIEQIDLTEVMRRLRTVFESYCNKKRNPSTSRPEMDLLNFLRLLRDAKLLDNRLTILKVQSVFEDRARAGTMGREGSCIDFDTFLAKLKKLLRIKNPAARSASRAGTFSVAGGLPFQRKSLSGATQLPLLQPRPSSGLSGAGASLMPVPRKSVYGSMALSMPLPLTEDPELVGVARSHILPNCRDGAGLQPVNAVYSPAMLELLREWDPQLRRMFAWYATLEETDPQRMTWGYVRSQGLTVCRTELMQLLLNFQVLPVLLSKHDALEVVAQRRRELNPGSDGSKGDPQSFPGFLEALAGLAVYIADNAKQRINESTASPDDMRTLRCYVQCCDGPLRTELEAAYQAASSRWSRNLVRTAGLGSAHQLTAFSDGGLAGVCVSRSLSAGCGDSGVVSSSGAGPVAAARVPPWLQGCEDDGVLAGTRQWAWQQKQQAACQGRLAVMARREDLRMKHALMRLHNTYRDVRTVSNNTVWPPSPQAVVVPGNGTSLGSHRQHMTRQSSPSKRSAADGAQPDAMTTCNVITFYSGSQQIKAPQPLSADLGSHLHVLPRSPWSAAPAQVDLAASSALAQPLSPPDTSASVQLHGLDPSMVLEAARDMDKAQAIQFVSSLIHSAHPGGRRNGGSLTGQPDSLASFVAGYGFVPMPTPKAQLQPIQPVDEYEAMLQLAEKLPVLKLGGS